MSKDEQKTWIVYYSYEGNIKFIAHIIARLISAEMLELKPIKEMNTKGFMKYIWGGQKVIFKQKPKLEPFKVRPEKYDLVFIGTPVYAYTFCPPILTFFSKVTLKIKKIAIFCCHEGGMRKTLDNMARKLQENSIIWKNDFNHPLNNKK